MGNLLGSDLQKKICVVLTGNEEDNDIEKLKDIALVECRIDEFLKRKKIEELPEWILKIKEKLNTKIIATIRWYKESGQNPYYIQDKERLEIFKKIITLVDFIDVELKSRILKEVTEIVKNQNKKVIVSYHNFKKTPNEKKLKEIVRKEKKVGDIVKIATLIKTEKNLFDLIKITYTYSKKIPLIIIPMSENPFVRFIPLFFGSLFTYVSMNTKVAPGQISYFEYSNFISKPGPDK